jgi:hypothetical protein
LELLLRLLLGLLELLLRLLLGLLELLLRLLLGLLELLLRLLLFEFELEFELLEFMLFLVGRRGRVLLLLFELELEFALRLPLGDLPVCTQFSTSLIDHDPSILSYPFQLIAVVLTPNNPSLSGSCIVP